MFAAIDQVQTAYIAQFGETKITRENTLIPALRAHILTRLPLGALLKKDGETVSVTARQTRFRDTDGKIITSQFIPQREVHTGQMMSTWVDVEQPSPEQIQATELEDGETEVAVFFEGVTTMEHSSAFVLLSPAAFKRHVWLHQQTRK